MEISEQLWEKLRDAAEAGDLEALETLLAHADGADQIHAFAHLDAEERSQILATLAPEDAATLLEQIPELHAVEAVQELAAAEAADILEELPSDDRADLISRLDAGDAEAILTLSEPETAQSVRELLRYPADSAGGRMVTEYVAVPASSTVEGLVDHLGRNRERYEDYVVQYAYALGPTGALVGVVPLRALLLARSDRPLSELMIPNPVSIEATAPLLELFELFEQHHFLGIPVVDKDAHLLGVLLREDVDEARMERAQEDERRSRGILGGEELRTLPLLTRSRRRLAWLSVNIVLNVLAASVIAYYEDTLAAVIALAVFLPMISDMSGCSGNQAVAVSLRELSLGVVRPSEYLRVWWQEASVGCLNGLVLGALIGAVAWVWKGNPALSAVVGAALALNTIVSVSIGGTVPLLLRRLQFDPALASGPILTTVTDMCGFFLALSFATAALGRITV